LESYGRTSKVLTPHEVARLERTFYFDQRKPYEIVLGISLGRLFSNLGKSGSVADLENLRKEFIPCNYILRKTQSKILVMYQKNASQLDVLRSYFHAQLYQYQEIIKTNNNLQSLLSGNISQNLNPLFEDFLVGLKESGWNTESMLLGTSEWRIVFKE